MKSFRIINLIHSDPLYYGGRNKFNITRGSTRENLEDVLKGKVDYSMISLVDYFKNRDTLKILDAPTISGKGHSNSNLLISRGEDPFPGMRVAVTSETETTAFYLKLILNKLFPNSVLIRNDSGKAEDLLQEEQFALVIGNNALDVYKTDLRIIFDITHMISKIFDLYSIYAVTVSLKETEYDPNLKELKNLEKWFITRHIDAISSDHNMSKSILRDYYNAITYDFNDIMKKEVGIYSGMFNEIANDIFLQDINEKTLKK